MGGHVQMERTILRQVPIEEQQGVGESLTLRDIWKIKENLKIWSQNFGKQQKHMLAGGGQIEWFMWVWSCSDRKHSMKTSSDRKTQNFEMNLQHCAI